MSLSSYKPRVAAASVAWLACGLAVACSSSSSTDTPGADASVPPHDATTGADTNAPADQAAPDAGGGDDASDGAATANPAHVGFFSFKQFEAPRWDFGGGFVSNEPTPPPNPYYTCTTSTAGECTLSICTPIDGGPPPPPPPLLVLVNPGDITVTGGTIPAGTKLAAVDGGGNGSSVGAAGVVVVNGDVIRVSAPGSADVPAFALSIVANPTYTVTNPACDAGTCPGVDRTKDYVFTWTGLAQGTLQVAFAYVNGPPLDRIVCNFPGAAGQGTIPSSLLTQFPGTAGIQLEAVSKNVTRAVVGDYGTTIDFTGNYFDRVLPIVN